MLTHQKLENLLNKVGPDIDSIMTSGIVGHNREAELAMNRFSKRSILISSFLSLFMAFGLTNSAHAVKPKATTDVMCIVGGNTTINNLPRGTTTFEIAWFNSEYSMLLDIFPPYSGKRAPYIMATPDTSAFGVVWAYDRKSALLENYSFNCI